MVVERVDGVQDARFSYERGEGLVTYDTTRTSPEQFIAALARMTDYRATLRLEPSGTTGTERPPTEPDSAEAIQKPGADSVPKGDQ